MMSGIRPAVDEFGRRRSAIEANNCIYKT